MRLVLVLAVAIVLVAALYFALSTEPASPGLVTGPVAPEATASRTDAPAPPELASDAKRASVSDPVSAPVRSSGAASAVRSRIAIAVVVAESSPPPVGLLVEFADALARTCALTADDGFVFRAADVAPGEWTVAARANGSLLAVERVTVRALETEQRFEIRLTPAPIVRVRWQADDGRPIVDVLASPTIRSLSSLARIAADDRPRAVGDPAPSSRQSFVFNVNPGAGSGGSQRNEPWPGAPADAVCEFTLNRATPAFLCASIDGAVVGAATVEDPSQEVVFRTPVELLRRLNATVSYCVLDAVTQDPVAGARVSGMTGAGIGRAALETGPTGCRVDPRFGPGRWLLEFSAPGRAKAFRSADLVPGAALDLGQVALTEPSYVTVRVRGADGSAAGAVRLLLYPAEHVEWSSGTSVSTDPEGAARFGELPPEPHVLVVADPRFARRSVQVQPHPPDWREVVELRAEPGVEIALDFGPQVSGGGRAYLYDGAGTFVSDASPPASGLVPLRLLPGSYTVELEGANGARAFTVTGESAIFDVH